MFTIEIIYDHSGMEQIRVKCYIVLNLQHILYVIWNIKKWKLKTNTILDWNYLSPARNMFEINFEVILSFVF
jgi:hypothetical protein